MTAPPSQPPPPLLILLDPPTTAPARPPPPAPRPAAARGAPVQRTAGLALFIAAGLGAGVGLRLHTHPNPALWAEPLSHARLAERAAVRALWGALDAITDPQLVGDGGDIGDHIADLREATWDLIAASQRLLGVVFDPETLLNIGPDSLNNGLSTSPIGRADTPKPTASRR